MLNNFDKITLKYLIFAALILLPTIAFPISSDLSVFMHGGDIIANGGGLFKDFFDIKPPLIYYIFAAINFLFGDNVIVFRLFDFLYQLAFLSLSAFIFKKLEVKTVIIKIFLIIFPLSYTILNYRDIFQTESLAFIPMLIYFYLTMRNKINMKSIILMGLTLGICISLKYTLGIIFLISIPIVLNNNRNIKSISKLILQLLIAVAILSISFLPIIIKGNLDGLIATNNYLVEYAKYPPVGTELFKSMIKSLYHCFGSLISISYLLFFVIACIFCFNSNSKKTLKNSLFFCLFLFISVLVEKKINMYHITRMYPFFMMIVSYGIYYFFKNFKFKLNAASISFVITLIFMSPLLRFVNTYKIAYDRVFRYDNYVAYYTNDQPFTILGHHIKIADYINKQGDERFLFLNTGGNQAIHYLNFDYRYKFPHSAFHLSPKAPMSYKIAFEEDIYDANIIAIDSSDDIFMIFLSEGSSYDLFFKNKKYKEYIESNFKLDTILLERYFIYRREQ